MATYIEMPRGLAGDERQQLAQMNRYLFEMAGRLNYALGVIDGTAVQAAQKAEAIAKTEKPSAATTFSQLKSLIIKSADIVEAYREQITASLAGQYVAKSEFGTYQQETAAQIQATAEGITQVYSNVQGIESNVAGLENALVGVTAYIKTGALIYNESGEPVYGLEIGQQTETDGAVSFQKFTRLVAGRLSFYDSNGTEVAYISDNTLHISTAEIQTLHAQDATVLKLMIGDYTIDAAVNGHLIVS